MNRNAEIALEVVKTSTQGATSTSADVAVEHRQVLAALALAWAVVALAHAIDGRP